MIGINFFRKIRAGSRLKAECVRMYALKSRTWKTRTEWTPPYAVCYNIPKDWLEGEAGGHVVTFWGKWGEGFTGEVMVGAFDSWWNRTIVWSEGRVVRNADKGDPGGRMAPLQNLESLLEANPSFERLGVSFKGVNLRFNGVPGPLLHAIIAHAAALAGRLTAREQPPLLEAVKAGDLGRAKALLEAGADPDEYGIELRPYSSTEPVGRYRYHDRPLPAAVMNDDAVMVALLISHKADLTVNPNHTLWVAIENGRHRALKALFDGGLKPSPWELPHADDFPLPFAASKGDLEAVRILLEAGLDPDQKRAGFFSDAHARAAGPRKEEIRRLLKEAQEREEQAEGRLALAPSADGAELSRSEEEKS